MDKTEKKEFYRGYFSINITDMTEDSIKMALATIQRDANRWHKRPSHAYSHGQIARILDEAEKAGFKFENRKSPMESLKEETADE
jgi:hypothetical protein